MSRERTTRGSLGVAGAGTTQPIRTPVRTPGGTPAAGPGRRARATAGGRTAPGVLLAAGALSLLTGCLGMEPFKLSGKRFKDDCLVVKAGDLCIDLEAGRIDIGNLTVCVEEDPGCVKLRRVRVGGWVDRDDDGVRDAGEEIEEFDHNVAEEEGSSVVSITGASISTGSAGGRGGDLHLCVIVDRVDGSTTDCLGQVFEDC